MSKNFYEKFGVRRSQKRKDIVTADQVELAREGFGLKKNEMAELMNLTSVSYSEGLKKGTFLLFRYYAALDAIECVALNKALRDVVKLHELRTGNQIMLTKDDLEASGSNDDDLE
jgi:hypothetical protein